MSIATPDPSAISSARRRSPTPPRSPVSHRALPRRCSAIRATVSVVGSSRARSAQRRESSRTAGEHLGLGAAGVQLGQHLLRSVVVLDEPDRLLERIVGAGGVASQSELVVDATQHPRGQPGVAGFHRLALGRAVLLEGFVARHASRAPSEARGVAPDLGALGPRGSEGERLAVVRRRSRGIEGLLAVAGRHEVSHRRGFQRGDVVVESRRAREVERPHGMRCEEIGLRRQARVGDRLEPGGHRSVQTRPGSSRQPSVRDVADEGVRERELGLAVDRAGRRPADQPAALQRMQRDVEVGRGGLERREGSQPESIADHRGGLQGRTIGGLERIEPGGDQGLHGIGHRGRGGP